MEQRRTRRRYKPPVIVALIIVGVICLGIGFSYGQASVYMKQHDNHSVKDIYNSKGSDE